jgi:transcriptional regulator with XRE-family HTH domain
MQIGQMIRSLRERQCLSQYDLAYLAKVSRVQINGIEQGRVFPRIDTIHKLCTALNVEITFNELSNPKGRGSADRGNRNWNRPMAKVLDLSWRSAIERSDQE